MADDDDKGRKKNTDRDFKPEHAERIDRAPRGAQGRPAAGMNGPGLGMSSRGRVLDQTSQQLDRGQSNERIVFRKSQEQAQADDKRPPALDPNKDIAIATGNPQHDKELTKDHNVITREQAEQMLGKDTVAQKFFDEPGAAAGQGSEPENIPDTDKQKAKELFDRMKKQRDRDKDLGR